MKIKKLLATFLLATFLLPIIPARANILIEDTAQLGQSFYFYLASQLKGFDENDKESYEFLTKALESDRKSGFLWNQKAYFEARLGNVEQAFKDARVSLSKDPNNFDTLVLLGKLAAVRQKPHQAIAFYRRALVVNPKNEEVYNLMARDYLILDDEQGALGVLNQCRRELPEATSCLYYLGTIHLEKGRYEQALSAFVMLLEYSPEQQKILNIVGEIYLKKGQFQKALDVFQQLAQVNPLDLSSQIRIGLLHYQLKNLDRAIREFRRVGKRFPKADKVNYFLGLMLMEKGDLKGAYGYFDRVTLDSPLFREAFNRQVTILKQTNRLSAAAALMDAKFKKKKIAEFYQLRASLQLMAEDHDDAMETLNAGLKKFKNDERMLFQRAVAYEKLDKWDLARRDLETIIKINPQSSDAYNYLGYSMAEHGEDLNEALAFAMKALKLKPEEGHILDSVGWIYFKMNQVEKALPLILKASKLETNEPTILEHAGDIYYSLKNRRQARIYYERALKILKSLTNRNNDEERQTRDIEQKINGL